MSEATQTTAASATRTPTQRTCEGVVVSETHWDRDWYMTFQQYRRRLVYVMDRLLDLLESKPSFKTFTFDGQACVLEDYLRIRPENEERIRRLAEERRLILGPWYTLPDEWLVSAESFIRNFFAGRRAASGFGELNTVGYCPDAFGHCNQLPQILDGLGLTCAIFTRGMGEELHDLGLTFRWLSADPEIGVLAIHQLGGYGNASALGYQHRHEDMPHAEFSLERVISYGQHILDRMGPLTRTKTLLLNNGVDHMEAQWNLPEAIEHVNQSDLPMTLRHGTFQDFVDAVNAENPELASHQGEFHHGHEHVILPGTLSTRRYLKQRNDRCQSLLEGHTEPLSAFAQLLLGGEDLRGFVHESWRLLLLNHPHDDICGCSIDQVHREMIPRFDESEQIAELIADESLRRLSALAPAATPEAISAVAVFNPSSWTRSGTVETKIVLPRKWSPEEFPEDPRSYGVTVDADEELRLVKSDGTPVPAEFTYLGERMTHTLSDFDPVFWQTPCHEWHLRASVEDLDPMGVTVLSIEKGEHAGFDVLSAEDNTLENEHLAVSVNPNGTLDIRDKATGHVHRGLLLFEDVGDAGDEYDFSGLDNPRAVTTAGRAATSFLLDQGPGQSTLRVQIPFTIPAALEESREARHSQMVDSSLTVDLTLRAGSPVLEAEIAWLNRAQDHRLRAVFLSDIVTDHASAEAHFDVLDRPLEPVVPTMKWAQNPVNFHPMDRYVSISDGKVGLAILGEGLKEYEASAVDGGTCLEVTLLRSVGWLSRGDLKNGRPVGNAGPQLPAPEGQCLGGQRVRLGIAPHAGDWRQGQIPRHGVEFNVPVHAAQCDKPEGTGAATSLVSIESGDLMMTACKIAEERDSLIVRVLNLGPEAVTSRVSAGFPVAEAHMTNLAEERQGDLAVNENGVEVTVRPKQLVTVELVPRG